MDRYVVSEARTDLAASQEALCGFEAWRDGLAWSGALPRHLWQELEGAAERVVAALDEIAAEARCRRRADEHDEQEERA
jgi:hypothetical protein